MLDCEVVLTKSGAPAMHDRATGETMHPVVGPLVEAREVYLRPSRLTERLERCDPSERLERCDPRERYDPVQPDRAPLVLLDVGLGAGSNALAAWEAAEQSAGNRRLTLLSIDHSLGAFELAQQPRHAAAFGFAAGSAKAARSLCETHAHSSARVDWRFFLGDLPEKLAERPDDSVDVVYWDPFSAASCPQLWTVAIFRDLRRVCRAGATVHTFCTSSPARSALLLAGFFVGAGATTGNGRATTLAAVDPGDVTEPLGSRFLARLERSSAPFPPDAPSDALERVRALPQFLA